jgi:hypothetical protein
MEAGNHHNVPCDDAIENTVRETAQNGATNVSSNDWKAFWIFSDPLVRFYRPRPGILILDLLAHLHTNDTPFQSPRLPLVE